MTKKINNIVFYDFEDAFGPHIQVCVFYEDGSVKNISKEEGKLAIKVLARQENIAISEIASTKKVQRVTGEKLEQEFQTFRKVEPTRKQRKRKITPRMKKARRKDKIKEKASKFSKLKKRKKTKKDTAQKKPGLFQRGLAKLRNSFLLKWAVWTVDFAKNKWEETKALPAKMKAKLKRKFSKKQTKEAPVSPWQEEYEKFTNQQQEQKSTPHSSNQQNNQQANVDEIINEENERLARNIIEVMAANNTTQNHKEMTARAK